MLRTIRLRGHLGKKFGKEYKLDVVSAAEAVRALCHQVKGFRQYMSEGNGKEQKFTVVVNKTILPNPEESLVMQSEGDIDIVPIIKGKGGDLGNAIFGGVLLASAIGFGPLGGLFVGEFAAFAGAGATITAGIGGAMLFSGLSGILFKPPSITSPTEKSADQQRSYLFNGAVNTVQQGQPIPIGYGKLKIGSQVVSVNVSTAQVPV